MEYKVKEARRKNYKRRGYSKGEDEFENILEDKIKKRIKNEYRLNRKVIRFDLRGIRK